MDDSGTRTPNHVPLTFNPERPEHFALGGILVLEENVDEVKAAHSAFCQRWSITYPLHSVEIRSRSKNFGWLRRDPDARERFLTQLEEMLVALPVLGLACVIDRPGYDARYREKYGRQQWQLCQTAFCVAVERAAKHALPMGRKLRVYPESCNPKDNRRLKDYFASLRQQGCPFDAETSALYSPLTRHDLGATLYEIDFKQKSNALVQIADLYLWPLVKHGYQDYRPYRALHTAGRVVDCHLPPAQVTHSGVKYSCFELVRQHQASETTKAQTFV